MLVVFIVDTSASMNQKVSTGLTCLDCVKSAIEHFIKIRQRDAACRSDRFLLVTTEGTPSAIMVYDRYPFLHFLTVLRGLEARALTSTGGAMQRTFDFLHTQRLAADVDRFGEGRHLACVECTMVMLLTDGTELTSTSGVSTSLMLPGGPVPPGSDLARQPFRWDQRVFASVLRIPCVSPALLERNGFVATTQMASMDSNISSFCEVTGGKCIVVTSWKLLMQHMEFMASRLHPCVVVSFEPIPPPGASEPPPPPLPPPPHLPAQDPLPPLPTPPLAHP